jgi:acyl carrier protein
MKDFIAHFEDQLFDLNSKNISGETIFRDLDDWDSLTAMAVIAMVVDEYGVKISDDDFKNLKTIQEVYDFIISNK